MPLKIWRKKKCLCQFIIKVLGIIGWKIKKTLGKNYFFEKIRKLGAIVFSAEKYKSLLIIIYCLTKNRIREESKEMRKITRFEIKISILYAP